MFTVITVNWIALFLGITAREELKVAHVRWRITLGGSLLSVEILFFGRALLAASLKAGILWVEFLHSNLNNLVISLSKSRISRYFPSSSRVSVGKTTDNGPLGDRRRRTNLVFQIFDEIRGWLEDSQLGLPLISRHRNLHATNLAQFTESRVDIPHADPKRFSLVATLLFSSPTSPACY